ncbi:N-acetylneuraminate synthase family protein [Candidatus Uhrbacteria bacterium]|nr:N-acetylneuraminate synthase family protein [Candidatus Uhrbacteria bacterium]
MQKEPFIIAEAAQGYEGSEKLVELLIKAAAFSGADAVKFQIMVADDSALPDYQHYDLFKTLELPWGVWEKAIEQTHRHGLLFYMDALGATAIKKLDTKGIDGYKIHSTNISNIMLLKLVASTKKPVLLSTGGCEKDEIDRALAIFKDCEIVIMHGFQAEPTELPDNHLKRISTLKELYKKPIGFQDHTAGDSQFAMIIPLVAMGAGATIMEKHITLSRVAKMEDYVSALNAEEFKQWVAIVRQVYAALGSKEWVLTDKEREYRKKTKRAVCALSDIAQGETIREEDIAFKRTAIQEVIYDSAEVVGRKATRAIQNNSPLKREDII